MNNSESIHPWLLLKNTSTEFKVDKLRWHNLPLKGAILSVERITTLTLSCFQCSCRIKPVDVQQLVIKCSCTECFYIYLSLLHFKKVENTQAHAPKSLAGDTCHRFLSRRAEWARVCECAIYFASPVCFLSTRPNPLKSALSSVLHSGLSQRLAFLLISRFFHSAKHGLPYKD